MAFTPADCARRINVQYSHAVMKSVVESEAVFFQVDEGSTHCYVPCLIDTWFGMKKVRKRA